MKNVDLNQPILFRHASMRFFEKNEKHITRRCGDDVLVLVFEGILRFREDGVDREVSAGQYYIQQAGLFQEGIHPSDSPQYLYAHFRADWTDGEGLAPYGVFSISRLKEQMEELDVISHSKSTYVEKAGCFYRLLTRLSRARRANTPADQIAEYIEAHYQKMSGLELLCRQFHYSKNHIINLFRAAYGVTPTAYINDLKLQRAMYLLEATSAPAETISQQCGFHTYSHFYRQFLRKTGQTPGGWRKAVALSPAQMFR